MEIIINNPDYYQVGKDKKRTRRRLKLIKDLGFTCTGIASFGIKGKMSGLYIEKIWSYSNEDFYSYLKWALSLTTMTTKVKKLYKEALKNQEFNKEIKEADSENYLKPNIFSSRELKHIYVSVYYGWLVGKKKY